MQKISEYTTERSSLITTDRFDVSADLGGGMWDTQYLEYGTLTTNLFGTIEQAGAFTSFGASTASIASMNVATGVDVSSPSAGDLWYNGTNLYFRDGVLNVDLLASGAGNTLYSSDDNLAGTRVVSLSDGVSIDYTLKFSSLTDLDLVYFDSVNDRVGIGTDTPAQKLHVNGNTQIDGDLSVDNDTFFVDASTNKVGTGRQPVTDAFEVWGGGGSVSQIMRVEHIGAGTGNTRAGYRIISPSGKDMGWYVHANTASTNRGPGFMSLIDEGFTGRAVVNFRGDGYNNMGLATGFFPAGLVYGMVLKNSGQAPTADVAGQFSFYAGLAGSGNTSPFFRTENGSVIKLYQETTAVSAQTFVANTSGISDDSATWGGYTVGQIVGALKLQGLLQ